MKKLNKYDAQKLALLERFFWEVQAAVYRTQAAAAAEDLDFPEEFSAAMNKIGKAAEKLYTDGGEVLIEQAAAGEFVSGEG